MWICLLFYKKIWYNLTMLEIRIHGRGGQGAVTAAELLAVAAFNEGYNAQAFPHFGVERRGAPVQAYVRISSHEIRLRSRVYNPEAIIILDPTLIEVVDVFEGCKKDTPIIINSEKDVKDFGFSKEYKILTIPASKIAMEIIGKPIINTIMLGAFAGVTELIKFSAIREAICHHFPPKLAEVNIKAANTAYCYSSKGDKYCKLTPKVCSITKDDKNKLKILCKNG